VQIGSNDALNLKLISDFKKKGEAQTCRLSMAYKSANLMLFRFLEPETGPLFCQFLLPIFNTSRGDEIEIRKP